jgi:hypothetical protein
MDVLTEGLYVYRPLSKKHTNYTANAERSGGDINRASEEEEEDAQMPYECVMCGKRFRLEQVCEEIVKIDHLSLQLLLFIVVIICYWLLL